MKKPLAFLLSLTFLFLFCGSVYGEEPEVRRTYWDNGKLKMYANQQILDTGGGVLNAAKKFNNHPFFVYSLYYFHQYD